MVMALNSGAKGINSSPICPRRKATCSTHLNCSTPAKEDKWHLEGFKLKVN
jgi:hypothetical protein